MTLDALVAMARDAGASDLHLESGLPPALRVRGTLKTVGDPVPADVLGELAREVIGGEHWPLFVERKSFDLSRTIQGVRCRVAVLQTARGVGLAIRLLATFQATVERLNLHPDLKKLVAYPTGLILVSGPTGSGKSSTLAALIQEINLTEPRHIVTIESPIEYFFRPRLAYIRQREVGRDTPSFEQALLDAMREDPDVLMVGEMRDPETMRLTLNAAETGHLVLSTVHAGTCLEALQRIAAAFPSESQNNICAQLADSLVAVIAQRLRFRPELNLRVPECEILVPTHAVKSHLRSREFFKIASDMEIGAEHGMWTWQRYRTWLDKKTQWFSPASPGEPPDNEAAAVESPPPAQVVAPHSALPAEPQAVPRHGVAGPIEIEPVVGGLPELLKKLK